MKIKVFIVTYDGENHLRDNLNSLFSSDNYNSLDIEVNIINNNTKFRLSLEHLGRVNVFHNVLRPDFSTGHLARNWNQAIINGFKSLTDPDCELLITSQDDVIWDHNWYSTLLSIMEKYTFYTCGNGDAVCAYKPEAVRRIGLWDERYCNIGYHEYDYFVRSIIYNGEYTSLNDIGEIKRSLWNPMPSINHHVQRDALKHENHMKSVKYHSISANVFQHKWGISTYTRDSTPDYWNWIKENVKGTVSKNFMFYPYFEKDVYELAEKNYVI
jgi:hypothetical protein